MLPRRLGHRDPGPARHPRPDQRSGRRHRRHTYEIAGPRRLLVTTDATGFDPSKPILQQECTQLGHSDIYLRPSECTPLPPAAPPFDGRSCGTIMYATGWPTVPPVNIRMGAGKCLLDAWAAGTPARLVTREQTDGQGGHILIKTYDVLGTGQLRVTTDPRQAAPAGPVTVQRCTTLADDGSYLKPGDCRPA